MLALVGVISQSLLSRYSRDVERSFKEDYASVKYCGDFAHALDKIDTSLQLHFWSDVPLSTAELDQWRQVADQQLENQRKIATLPNEKELTDRTAQSWEQYKQIYHELLDASAPLNVRRERYAQLALPKAIEVLDDANRLIDINMNGMLPLRDRVTQTVSLVRRTNWIVMGAAAGMAVIFALLIGQTILRPLNLLTDSVRQIEGGELDLRLPIPWRDEIGDLGAAINSMASQLKAYRHAEQERLLRTERATQLAIDSMPDAVFVLKPDGNVELANVAAGQLLALRPGANAADYPQPWLAELHARLLSGAVGKPKLAGYDATVQLECDGETRYFLPRAVPITSDEQQTLGAMVVMTDVSSLRRLDEMKNGLLSLVSHELKTPLTSMRMILHLVSDLRVGALTPRQKELMDAAREDADRLHEIVENLLDMARIESGRALMEMRPQSPAALAQQAVAALKGMFESQGVELTVDLPQTLPDVEADATRIRHVLINLLNNALRFTPAKGHVKVWARSDDAWVELAVSDDGSGIARQHLPRIFEKFFRVPGQQTSTGSGLGLAIARDIIDAHGGSIRVESAEGKGSTFAFTLRRVARDANAVASGT